MNDFNLRLDDMQEDLVINVEENVDELVLEDDFIVLLDEESDDLVMSVEEYDDLILETDVATVTPYPEYTGEHIVTPILYDNQTLSTQHKVLKQDITVKPIPVIQTTNPYGGQTVVIG